MNRWKKEPRIEAQDRQILAFGSLWNRAIQEFSKKYMPDRLICIGSKAEAAVYGGLDMVNFACFQAHDCLGGAARFMQYCVRRKRNQWSSPKILTALVSCSSEYTNFATSLQSTNAPKLSEMFCYFFLPFY